jgi:hypothetical protein
MILNKNTHKNIIILIIIKIIMFAVYSTEESVSPVPNCKNIHFLGIFTDIKLAQERVKNDKEEKTKMHKDMFISFHYIIKCKPDVARKITDCNISYQLHNEIVYYSDSDDDNDKEEEEEKNLSVTKSE